MKWKKERDLLIAQTAAFVESVTGKKPEIAARIEPRSESISIGEVEQVGRPVEIVAANRPSPIRHGGFREEIQERVAAFRAHQQLFDRERDAYFKAVLTKVRVSIGSRPEAPGD